jgi:hypothetical protein
MTSHFDDFCICRRGEEYKPLYTLPYSNFEESWEQTASSPSGDPYKTATASAHYEPKSKPDCQDSGTGFAGRPPSCGASCLSSDCSLAWTNSSLPKGRPVCVLWRTGANSVSVSSPLKNPTAFPNPEVIATGSWQQNTTICSDAGGIDPRLRCRSSSLTGDLGANWPNDNSYGLPCFVFVSLDGS